MASEFNLLMLRHLSSTALRYIPVIGLLAAAVIQAQGTPVASPSAADASPSAAKPASEHRLVDRWALGGEGGWDYPTVDSAAHRLYLSRATRVAVIDTRTGKAVGEVPDTPGVHGIAVAADFHRGYASAGKADAVRVFDLDTLRPIDSIAVGAHPDAIVYDPQIHEVVTLNGEDNSASVIDVAKNKVIGTIALPGTPEFARSDGAGHVFVNIEDKNEVAVLDLASQKVTAVWPLTGCERPTGLALDARNGRSFSGCGNAVMVVSDTRLGKSIATLPIGHGVDGVEFDVLLQNAYSANGEGTLTVVHEGPDPQHFAVAETLPTARGARTIALDAATHRLYLPTAQFGPTPAATTETPRPRPPILPGTFEVLVVGTGPAAVQ
jgi:DNA-binding beta-propeller fold protein YncE